MRTKKEEDDDDEADRPDQPEMFNCDSHKRKRTMLMNIMASVMALCHSAE